MLPLVSNCIVVQVVGGDGGDDIVVVVVIVVVVDRNSYRWASTGSVRQEYHGGITPFVRYQVW